MQTTKLFITLSIAASLALSGCANTGGAPITGSYAGDYGTMGAVGGGLLGYLACAGLKGSKGQCTNIAVAGAAAGGFAGYQQGKTMDVAKANEIQANAQRIQGLIAQQTQMPSQFQMVQVPVQTQQGVQQVNLPKAVEMPVATIDMINAKTGGLNQKAIKNLSYMDRMASQNNSDFMVYVPSSQIGSMSTIQKVAPNAKVFESRDINQFILIVQPRV